MAIPKLTKQNIMDALAYIDKNGVPDQNKSTKYFLCTEGDQKYPPKYVIAVANHIVSDEDIITEGYNAVEAKNFLEHLGFTIETKQEKYELTITADHVISNDESFTMDNLGLGDNYIPDGTAQKQWHLSLFHPGGRRKLLPRFFISVLSSGLLILADAVQRIL